MGRRKDYLKRRKAFEAYRRLGTLTAVSQELDIDVSQLSRWSNEEQWDNKIQAVRTEVAKRLGTDDLEKQIDEDVWAEEEIENLRRFRYLALSGLKEFEEGRVSYTRMSEVLQALRDYDERLRLVRGSPTERTETTHNVNLTSLPENRKLAIQALIAIAQDSEEDEVIKEIPPPE